MQPDSDFTTKHNEWSNILSGDDQHSIFNQLVLMTQDIASFSLVNEALRIAPPAKEGGVQRNCLMHHLLARNFFEVQLIRIRRLAEPFQKERKREVYSLASLLHDVEKHHNLITRSAIFGALQIPYDYELLFEKQEKFWQERVSEISAGERAKAFFIPPELDHQRSFELHLKFDRLAGTCPEDRVHDDTLQPHVVQDLKKQLWEATVSVKTYVDKFIAHAASPKSREAAKADSINVPLRTIKSAHKHLCNIANKLSSEILGDTELSFLPLWDAKDILLYLDEPLVMPENKQKLEEYWHDLEEYYRNFTQDPVQK